MSETLNAVSVEDLTMPDDKLFTIGWWKIRGLTPDVDQPGDNRVVQRRVYGAHQRAIKRAEALNLEQVTVRPIAIEEQPQ